MKFKELKNGDMKCIDCGYIIKSYSVVPTCKNCDDEICIKCNYGEDEYCSHNCMSLDRW